MLVSSAALAWWEECGWPGDGEHPGQQQQRHRRAVHAAPLLQHGDGEEHREDRGGEHDGAEVPDGQPHHGGVHAHHHQVGQHRLQPQPQPRAPGLGPQEAEPGAGEDGDRQREVDRAPGRGMVRISQAKVTSVTTHRKSSICQEESSATSSDASLVSVFLWSMFASQYLSVESKLKLDLRSDEAHS